MSAPGLLPSIPRSALMVPSTPQTSRKPPPGTPRSTRQIDSRGASLSTWPTGRFSELSARGVPRCPPPLLVELEAYIKRELLFSTSRRSVEKHDASSASEFGASVTTVATVASPDQLRVFSEALATMGNHFAEYGSLFTAIKTAFDDALAAGVSYRNRITDLERELTTARCYVDYVVEAETASLRKKADAALQDAHNSRHDLAVLRAEHEALQKRLNEFQREIDAQKVELVDGHNRGKLLNEALRSESDRQAVVVDTLRKLRSENAKLQSYCQVLEDNARDDQLMIDELREKLKVLQPAEREGTSSTVNRPRFTTVVRAAMAAHSSTTDAPLTERELDAVEHRLAVETKRCEELSNTVAKLENTIAEQRKELATERDNNGPLTPRPNWSVLKPVVQGFDPRPQQTSHEITVELFRCLRELTSQSRRELAAKALSRAVLRWLGDENLCESDLNQFSTSFVGYGTGPDIPLPLRYHGRVRNNHLRKRDVEQLLKRFWTQRQERRRAEGAEVASIETFAKQWFREISSSDRGAVELAYNIMHVCAANRHDTDCLLFHDIIWGDLSEEVFHDSQSALDQLARQIRNSDKRAATGVVARHLLFKLVRRVFPAKPLDHVLRLRYTLLTMLHPDEETIDYERLLEEDIDGNQTPFVECLRQQHIDEVREALIDAEEKLRDAASERGVITLGAARTVLLEWDKAVPSATVTRILAVGFSLLDDQVNAADASSATVEIGLFIRRIRAGALVKRYSPSTTSVVL